MCVAAAAAGTGWRVLGTDLGVNIYSEGRREQSRTVRGRLQQAGSGWVAGSGDARMLAGAFTAIDDPPDRGHVRRVVQDAAQTAARRSPEPSTVWEDTNVLTASPDGIRRFRASGEWEEYAAGGYLLLTPPDYDDGRELSEGFTFDPSDVDSGVNAVLHALSEVAKRSAVTATEVSIGLLVRRDGRWKRGRMDESLNGS